MSDQTRDYDDDYDDDYEIDYEHEHEHERPVQWYDMHMTSINIHWYRQSFGALYPIIYANRTVEAAGREAEFAVGETCLSPVARVLDLCCGNGRHMVHLARHTPHVVGLDYSPDLLALAHNALGNGARLLRGDMRALPFGAVFDVVFNFFTSFGYFAAFEENLGVVREMARVLKPGGRCFIDYLNATYVRATLVPESVREYKGYVIRERRWIDNALERVNKTITVSRDAALVGEWQESVHLYDEPAFRALLVCGGLCVDRVYGNYDGASRADGQPRMIVVGHKEKAHA